MIPAGQSSWRMIHVGTIPVTHFWPRHLALCSSAQCHQLAALSSWPREHPQQRDASTGPQLAELMQKCGHGSPGLSLALYLV